MECLFCGSPITLRKPSEVRKYCNNDCQHAYQAKVTIDTWLKTGVVPTAARLTGCIKKFILESQCGKCSHCGIDSWNNKPIVLEVEHKDGNYLNNWRENLELICPNCHSQTETYKGKNKGNGRHYRMQRRAEGKSF